MLTQSAPGSSRGTLTGRINPAFFAWGRPSQIKRLSEAPLIAGSSSGNHPPFSA
jgi:hypothetical protein